MAQIDQKTEKFAGSLKIIGNSAVEQHLRGEGGSRWSPTSSSLLSENEHEQKDFDPVHHQKKSVLTKVKENAMKLKHTFSNKKKPEQVEDCNSTTPSSVVEDDGDEEDAEFLGAPMYESEKSPQGYKETLRQHPRADPVISENHLLQSFGKHSSEHEEEKLHNLNPHEMPASLKKLSLVETESHHPPFESSSSTYNSSSRKILAEPTAVNSNKKMTRSMTEKLAPTHLNSLKPDHPVLTPRGRLPRETPFSAPEVGAVGGNERGQVQNDGVSINKSWVHKFVAGEEMAQEKIPADIGVLEKIKETVSSLLWTNEPSQSTNACYAGEEAETGRTLQPN